MPASSRSTAIDDLEIPGGKRRFDFGRINVNNMERWASVLGGAALAALALRRRSKGAVGLAALAGAPLLWRGATGHCAVYQKLGIDRTQQGFDTLDVTDDFDRERNRPLDGITEARPVTTTDRQPIGQNL
jgi:hypothetical protein